MCGVPFVVVVHAMKERKDGPSADVHEGLGLLRRGYNW